MLHDTLWLFLKFIWGNFGIKKLLKGSGKEPYENSSRDFCWIQAFLLDGLCTFIRKQLLYVMDSLQPHFLIGGMKFVFFRIRSCWNNFFLVHLIIGRSSLACSPRVFHDIFIVHEIPSPKLSILSVCECVPACVLPIPYCFLSIFPVNYGRIFDSHFAYWEVSLNFWEVKVRKNCKHAK